MALACSSLLGFVNRQRQNGTHVGAEGPRTVNISEILRMIQRYNEFQTVLNEDIYGPLQNDSVIIVVQGVTRLTRRFLAARRSDRNALEAHLVASGRPLSDHHQLLLLQLQQLAVVEASAIVLVLVVRRNRQEQLVVLVVVAVPVPTVVLVCDVLLLLYRPRRPWERCCSSDAIRAAVRTMNALVSMS
uniref:Uncharacterized protein n=1 Tax=Anopheles atroparvus TaxID=41427 RepID=A0A182ITM0_ANOAO